jgi:hypothetical protein
MRRHPWLLLTTVFWVTFALASQVSSRAFLSGTIQSISGNTIYAANTDSQPITLRLSPSSNIWKGQDGLDISVLRPGDHIYVDGTWNPDGSVTVRELDANIVNYFGQVVSVAKDQFEIIPDKHTRSVKALLSANNPPTVINNGQGSAKDVQVGRYVQMIGLLRDDGTVLATRIWTQERSR